MFASLKKVLTGTTGAFEGACVGVEVTGESDGFADALGACEGDIEGLKDNDGMPEGKVEGFDEILGTSER